jgi:NTP pyrophosphatase (non-canonical NTP hydrolase)
MASKEQLYEASMEKWKLPAQLDMLAEECCELAQSALKLLRLQGGTGLYSLTEELADVEIMSEQIIHCLKLREQVDMQKEKKLRRLAHILESNA